MEIILNYNKKKTCSFDIKQDVLTLWVMVFNTTLNNISVISWRSVFLEEKNGVPVEKHRPAKCQ